MLKYNLKKIDGFDKSLDTTTVSTTARLLCKAFWPILSLDSQRNTSNPACSSPKSLTNPFCFWRNSLPFCRSKWISDQMFIFPAYSQACTLPMEVSIQYCSHGNPSHPFPKEFWPIWPLLRIFNQFHVSSKELDTNSTSPQKKKVTPIPPVFKWIWTNSAQSRRTGNNSCPLRGNFDECSSLVKEFWPIHSSSLLLK